MSVNFIASSTDAITGIFHVMSITHTSNELSLNVHIISTFSILVFIIFSLLCKFFPRSVFFMSRRVAGFSRITIAVVSVECRVPLTKNAWKIFNGAITRDLKLRRCFGTNTPIPSTNEIESAGFFQVTGYTCIDYRYYARVPIVKRLVGETLKRRTV